MDEEKLIIVVQKNPELWDMSKNSYHNQERKDVLWEEIATQNFQGITGLECKKKWFSLRDGFRRNLKKRKTTTGQRRKPHKLWRFEKEMEFLLPCFEERAQLSNIESQETDEDSEHQSSEPPTPPAVSSAASCLSHSEREGTSNINVPSRKKKKRSPTRAADVLKTYLEKKGNSSAAEDQLTKFFQSMELTVRSLPYPLQIDVKSKIFNVVTEAEITALRQSSQASNISLQSGSETASSFPQQPCYQDPPQTSIECPQTYTDLTGLYYS